MTKSTAARAAARFKQLCCFGLNKEAVVPSLLSELHAIVPSLCNSFLFADKSGELVSAYLENTETIRLYPLYQQEFREGREREFKGFAFSDVAKTQIGPQDFRSTVSVDQNTFHRSDLYNLVIRPAGNGSNFLRFHFRIGGRVLGGLTMWRGPNANEWSVEEKRRLISLELFFIHALTAGDTNETALVDSGEIGLIIATSAGKPIFFSDEGRRLLYLTGLQGAGTSASLTTVLPTPVVQLCTTLSQIFADGASVEAPIYCHSNAWGCFTFRAQWLEGNDAAPGVIAITVSQKVPQTIRLMRSVRKLPLTRRQAEVCLLMATGASNEMVADRLGISKHTVVEHGRWIYNSLEVHNRVELVSKLLSS